MVRPLMSKKKTDDGRFNPEKYRMNFCHEYHGLGKTFNKENSEGVCQVCVGFKQGSGFEEEVGTWPVILYQDLYRR